MGFNFFSVNASEAGAKVIPEFDDINPAILQLKN
jgi:hypothetical protein